MAELFRQLAHVMGLTRHGKWVRIFGMAAMVYAALTVTRMHDLMVTIALAFFVGAEIVFLHLVLPRRQSGPRAARKKSRFRLEILSRAHRIDFHRDDHCQEATERIPEQVGKAKSEELEDGLHCFLLHLCLSSAQSAYPICPR